MGHKQSSVYQEANDLPLYHKPPVRRLAAWYNLGSTIGRTT